MFDHLKKHARAYSLGFLALVAVCVSYLYVQVDELENQQMTGWVNQFNSPKKIAIPSNRIAIPSNSLTVGKKDTELGNSLNGDSLNLTSPSIQLHQPLSSALANGENELLSFEVTSPDYDYSINTITFVVDHTIDTTDGVSGLSEFRIKKGAEYLNPAISQNGKKITLTFSPSERVKKGQGSLYQLVASAKGVGVADQVFVSIESDGFNNEKKVIGDYPLFRQLGN